MCPSNISDSRSRTSSWWDTVSTTPNSIATCRASRSLPNRRADRRPHLLTPGTRVTKHLYLVDGPYVTVAHEYLPVDDGRADVGAARNVNEMRYRVVHGRLTGTRYVDQDQVRALAGLERANARFHAERPGAADGRHLQRRPGAYRTGIR